MLTTASAADANAARRLRIALPRSTVLAIATVASAAALNLGLQLATQSLFVDEGSTWEVVRGAWADVSWKVKASELAPPLYYEVLHGWVRAVGSASELAMRLPSAVCGVLLVGVVGWLTARVATRRVALVAAGITAVSPALVVYGQQARAYAPVMLAVTTAVACLIEARRSSSRAWLVASGAALAVGMSLHYTAWVAGLAVCAGVLMTTRFSRPQKVGYLLAAVLVVTVNAMWLRTQLRVGSTHHAGFSWNNLAQVTGAPFVGRQPEQWPPVVGSLAVAVSSVLVLARRWAVLSRFDTRLLLGTAWLPVVAVLVSTATGHGALWPRYVAVGVPFMTVVVAVAASHLRLGRVPGGATLAVVPVALALTGSVLSHDPNRSYYGDTRGAVALIAQRWSAGDEVVNATGYLPLNWTLDYYATRVLHHSPLPPSAAAIDRALQSGHRVWALSFPASADAYRRVLGADVVVTRVQAASADGRQEVALLTRVAGRGAP